MLTFLFFFYRLTFFFPNVNLTLANIKMAKFFLDLWQRGWWIKVIATWGPASWVFSVPALHDPPLYSTFVSALNLFGNKTACYEMLIFSCRKYRTRSGLLIFKVFHSFLLVFFAHSQFSSSVWQNSANCVSPVLS